MAAVALPVQPRDGDVQLPPAPAYPPTVAKVCDAVEYRSEVEASIGK